MTENLNNPQVPSGEPNGAAPSPAAPVTQVEPIAPAMPSTPPTDAEKQRAELERKLNQYENDIRALKSASDKRLNDAQKNWEAQQRQWQKELQTLRMASMDDDERKQYEASLASERQQEIEQELEQLRTNVREYQANLNAVQYFLQQGVPADQLVIDQGYDALFTSGMTWMANEVKRVHSSSQPSAAQPNALPTPPVVAAASSGVPNVKPSWQDLRNKYGSDEQIYRLVEAGLLPGDLIPG